MIHACPNSVCLLAHVRLDFKRAFGMGYLDRQYVLNAHAMTGQGPRQTFLANGERRADMY